MLFVLTKEQEADCPHCPVHDTDDYVRHHLERRRGTWAQLAEYADRICRYFRVACECSDGTRAVLARLACIPAHRRDVVQYQRNGRTTV